MKDYRAIAEAFIGKHFEAKWQPTAMETDAETLAELMAAVEAIGRMTVGARFTLTSVNRPVYERAVRHIVMADVMAGVQKGLFIYGKAGCGKTVLMRTVGLLAHAVNLRNNHAIYSTVDIVHSYTASGPNAFTELQLTGGTLCLDDVGSEPTEAGYYGTRVPVIAGLIDLRYRLWCRAGRWTHFTSNFDLDWIENAVGYGPREADRIKEMCHVIHMPGDSMRK